MKGKATLILDEINQDRTSIRDQNKYDKGQLQNVYYFHLPKKLNTR